MGFGKEILGGGKIGGLLKELKVKKQVLFLKV